MKTIAIVTRTPDSVADYFGFGCHEVDRGISKFGDHVIIAECPDEHAEWNATRLGSGLHGARIVDDLEDWCEEWGYTSWKVDDLEDWCEEWGYTSWKGVAK